MYPHILPLKSVSTPATPSLGKRVGIFLLSVFLLLGLVFYFYCNNTRLADIRTRQFYKALQDTLQTMNLPSRFLVVSTARNKFYNQLLVTISHAAPNSRHIKGDAIDFIVLDINSDGQADARDVDLVYAILDKSIIRNKGGIGTYKNSNSFFYRQMVHIDSRGYYARWYK
jgi:uncharacterized protein YcbK (DUF882 family)